LEQKEAVVNQRQESPTISHPQLLEATSSKTNKKIADDIQRKELYSKGIMRVQKQKRSGKQKSKLRTTDKEMTTGQTSNQGRLRA
jgi:hypothetical protein